ncbi:MULTISPECIES: LpqN/LpqT family lipoprotein [unclassified Rhodococcus (in: high G+C Gram-positive bacteria)]|uniref:LpqN/LpqT family lipoprotein n=1 Tax=unclassified Rhodococcus (in: high G+C Gram-positive bacteria) TaxID=192944 RepID=UPI0029547980|nr:LpqN/LpqT family lipoprotein [Rhodococcus sp. IEGM 1318]MDV8006716.1 LpqN/LpqT family lipoprotein [Rhodococcus sp. IEGM 1318]MDZ7911834.1 LpqN/LpqT family lipoprotein [Rhodococcus sp. (in: high G+C Gram-positive bacteria)]
MSPKSSTLALGIASLITAALVLSGCSSSESGDAVSSETTTSESSASSPSAAAATPTLRDGTPFIGERTTIETGNDPEAPSISVSLPPSWTQGENIPAGVTDALSSNSREPSGFMPNTTVKVENHSTATKDEVLAAERETIATLDGWTEVKYTEIDVDGQQGFRLSGTWTAPNLGVPLYAVMTVVAYQADDNSPVYLVSFANQFTDTTNMQTSNQVEEINTSIEFG